jgi:hypothetical protein
VQPAIAVVPFRNSTFPAKPVLTLSLSVTVAVKSTGAP